jgi:hypothetical protein
MGSTRAGLGGEAVAGGRMAEEYMLFRVMGGTPFLRVSSRPVSSFALGDSWVGSEQCTSQRDSAASSKRPRLSLNCPICLDPARVSALLHGQFACSQHVQGLENLVTRSLPSHVSRHHSCHTCYGPIHPLANITMFNTSRSDTSQPLSINVPPAQYLWGKCSEFTLTARSILSIHCSRVSQESKTVRPIFADTPQPLVIAPLKTAKPDGVITISQTLHTYYP